MFSISSNIIIHFIWASFQLTMFVLILNLLETWLGRDVEVNQCKERHPQDSSVCPLPWCFAAHLPLHHREAEQRRGEDPWCQRRWRLESVLRWDGAGDRGRVRHEIRNRIDLSGHDVSREPMNNSIFTILIIIWITWNDQNKQVNAWKITSFQKMSSDSRCLNVNCQPCGAPNRKWWKKYNYISMRI